MKSLNFLENLLPAGENASLIVDGKEVAIGKASWHKSKDGWEGMFVPSSPEYLEDINLPVSLLINGRTILIAGFEKCYASGHWHFHI